MIAATFAILFGASAVAQTGAAGATSAGSSQKNPSSSTSATSSGTTSSGSTYEHSAKSNAQNPADASTLHTGAAADVDATKEINAQTNASTTAGAATGRESTSNKLGWMDRRFVSKVADSGQDEINLAKLATERASNAEVKSYAQKLVDDHTAVAEELKGIAGQKNVKLDTDNDQDRTYKRMSKKSGADFDREFVEHMIDEHEKDIKLFEKAAKDAKDPDVRSFASKHVDHLRQHLQQAQSLRQTVMPTGRMDDRSGRSTSGATSSNDYSTPTSSSSSSTSNSDTSATPSTSTSTSSSSNDNTTSSSSKQKNDAP